ncbi:squalene/phytoene synthase family protein [Corynebacterium incognita]|uniref:Squalene/phytoene synthase family protein n=1 Tax=Corynebacterium incognita TaxID=2754725 RepID=A0A7G7CN97_9CORY|nr:squalene/phytoene synthase family protein [Corynebacterium incognita]QNE89063.1 squalene/phytoene synthase family protein [Corynebacterium incognita]
MSPTTPQPGPAGAPERFTRMSHKAAAQVIAHYSTSFSLATSLLSRRVRRDIRSLYAMVRIADEIVDGAAAGASPGDVLELLDGYEEAVFAALSQPLVTDPILHAFADTARRCRFDPEHLRAFFRSMRADAAGKSAPLGEYIYGSAEVIGMLCVDVFIAEEQYSAARRDVLDEGARRLGAGFQKVNFLRDIADDEAGLNRDYLAGAGRLDEGRKQELVSEIRADFAAARDTIDALPMSVRAGVHTALGIFEELNDMIDRTPAEQLYHERLSVPRARKAVLALRAMREAARR